MSADWHPVYVAVRAIFEADSALVAIAPSGQLHADQLSDKKAMPAIRYTLIAPRPDQRLANGDNLDAELQVDAYGERNDEITTKALSDAVVRLLDRVTLDVDGYGGVASMCVARPTPFKEHPYFRLMARFRLFGSAV